MSNWMFKKDRLLATTLLAGLAFAGPAFAQQASEEDAGIVITGTRIQQPGIVSASPITSVGAEEIRLQQVVEAEKLLRSLPSTVPGDGQNTNNGSVGATTVNLRGLGDQRNLILLDGKRLLPYDVDGLVDISVIPTALLQRVDVVTGGASAVYGSDAISGAVNFILKPDFEGVDLDTTYSVTGEGDGNIYGASLTVGSNMADGRGNAALNISYSKREPVLLSARPYGRFNVDSASGSGLGATPPAAPANCTGPGTQTTGSGTTVPARIILDTGTSFQFRNDGTLGANCNGFNFNPFNYYQTPQERISGTAIGTFEVTDDIEAYARTVFMATNVRQQVAPSGVFFDTFAVPLANPYLPAAARATIIGALNTALTTAPAPGDPAPTFGSIGVVDVNGNGVVDIADTANLTIGRRTIEFGERSTSFDSNLYQVALGLRGDIGDNLDWDVSFQHGESKRTQINAGYTNLVNIANALNATSTTTCANGDPTCVPINLFGNAGSITPAMAQYSSASALLRDTYRQTIGAASLSGVIPVLQSPMASSPLAFAVGIEHREEEGTQTPDECLKVAPSSCLGGFGGYLLPTSSEFSVNEIFGEAIVPLVSDQPFFHNLGLELGIRSSDYDPFGSNETWKVGLNWDVFEEFRVRGMRQKAVRAPNIGEFATQITQGLDNATLDPCSVGNTAPISATLRALCISTGMTNAQVGVVSDISAGQVNVFVGTDPVNRPGPEEADTTTVGFVWQPTFLSFLRNPVVTLDYYKIEIEGYIANFSAQEVLDACYSRGDQSFCSLINRVNGGLLPASAGINTFTRNLDSAETAGIELSVSADLDLATLGLDEKWGSLSFALTGNQYLTSEVTSSASVPTIDCLGYYGSACNNGGNGGSPTHEFRWNQRTTWAVGPVELSYLWRHLSEVSIRPDEAAALFPAFRSIEAFDYIDIAGTYSLNENIRVTASVTNVAEEDPPIIGNTTGTTSANSGNTFPSNYDPLGRVFSVGLNLRF